MTRMWDKLKLVVVLLCVAACVSAVVSGLLYIRDAERNKIAIETQKAALLAERNILAIRLKAVVEANAELDEKVTKAGVDQEEFERELADYAAQIKTNADCSVDADLFDRLR